ncbi:MAG: TIGR00341 family protein [Anaerolineae bacterium]|jgi:uncharacterized hydrophobic protein (TIGR00271 family)|nr:TIGR00341 family protein [Anaerolineae bacterium]
MMDRHRRQTSGPYRVLVAVGSEHDLAPLLRTARAIAGAGAGGNGEVRVLTVTRSGSPPAWLSLPDADADDHVSVEVATRAGRSPGAAILAEIRAYDPDLLLLGLHSGLQQGRYLLGRTLDPVIQGAPCGIIVQRGSIKPDIARVLIPAAGGPNAPQALPIARALAPQAHITALYVANARLGQPEILVGHARLDTMVQRLGPEDQQIVETKVISAASPVEGILTEAHEGGYDLVIVGAGREGPVDRFLFGDIPQVVLDQSNIPVMVIRPHLSHLGSFWRKLWGRIFGFVAPLTVQEQADVQKAIRRGSQPSPDFFVMLTLAAILATLGLLMNNPSVIIGAMIVAPLMTAILGMGLSIVLGDPRFFWRAAATTLRGILLALAMGFIVGHVVPGVEANAAISAMAQPTILDLAVALTAGAAAAYAISRKEILAALAGVAVAASLTPPLVNVGLTLALAEPRIALGAGLLFLANLVAIVATSGFVFLWMGFRPHPGDPGRTATRRRGFYAFAILLILIAIPLLTVTQRSLSNLAFRRSVEAAITAEVAQVPGGELVQWDYTLTPEGTLDLVLTMRAAGSVTHQRAQDLQEAIATHLAMPVALSLTTVPTQQLHAFVPPTPTLTPTLTPTGVPTATPTSTPTATSTATPTPTATPTSTPIPTITPHPTATPTATPWVLTVVDVGSVGLRVRYSPEGVVMGRLTEGTLVVVLAGPVEADGVAWYRVSAPTAHIDGWVDGAYLSPGP